MPVKVVESNLNVLQAAKIRIRNVFANGCKIYLSFSSGKDSLCISVNSCGGGLVAAVAELQQHQQQQLLLRGFVVGVVGL